MQIYGPSQLHGAQSINAPHVQRIATPQVNRPSAPADQLDISQAGELAARLSEIPDIRSDRVASIRAAIANGTYETAQKLDTAVSRLLDEIG